MRDSINITLTDPLRRASVRPRLDALAGSTGFAAAQIAGRALLLGLRAIEQDWRLLFPGSDPTSPATPSAPTHQVAEPEHAPAHDATPSDAPHRTEAQHTADASTTAPAQAPPLDAQPDPAQPSIAEPAGAPAAAAEPGAAPDPEASAAPASSDPEQRGRVATHEAAQALGHSNEVAFRQHIQRHPELRQHAQRAGRTLIWDLDGLRDAYRAHGYRIKGQPAHEHAPASERSAAPSE